MAVADAAWSYQVTKQSGDAQTLSLDSRILNAAVADSRRVGIQSWLQQAAQTAGVAEEVRAALRGAVFEVRQGYKSKDSKRQNADVANAGAAYAAGYLPVVVLLSTQIDDSVALRYTKARWLLLYGTLAGSELTSTYIFSREILGYDLAGFFQRHAATLQGEVRSVLETLLS